MLFGYFKLRISSVKYKGEIHTVFLWSWLKVTDSGFVFNIASYNDG